MPDLIVRDKAGERILEGLLADASQRLREEGVAGDIRVFKTDADPAGSSSGCDEHYLIALDSRSAATAGSPGIAGSDQITGSGGWPRP